MLLYKAVFSYYDPFNIIFLCGSKYAQKNIKDKRNVLKKFLKTKLPGCSPIILEENFIFAATNKNYLSYDDIFLKNLAQVEQLASLYANKIVIIHETISTAAELGMFAINPILASKICLLIPDDISIEEKKVSGFIKLAFFGSKTQPPFINKQITYYPDIEIARRSLHKSDYHTYFHKNEVGKNLGSELISFINPKTVKKQIKMSKFRYNKPKNDDGSVDYCIDENGKFHIFITVEALKIQLLALFFVNEHRSEFRRSKPIHEHLTFICDQYKKLLINTILEIEGFDNSPTSISITLKNTEICKFRQAVGHYLYMLQAANLIKLEQTDNLSKQKRKIVISNTLDSYKDQISDFIYAKPITEFGRVQI